MLNSLHELRAFIQKNCPMFLTNDLTLYAIIGKVVWYTNELIRRSNELNDLLGKLEDMTDEELKRLNQAVTNFINLNNQRFIDFTTEINGDLLRFKGMIEQNYQTFTEQQMARLDEITRIVGQNLEEFQRTIVAKYNSDIERLTQELTDFIDMKTTEISKFKDEEETKYTTTINQLKQDFTQGLQEANQQFTDSLNSYISEQTQKYTDLENQLDTIETTKNEEVQTALDNLRNSIEPSIQDYITNTYVSSSEFRQVLADYYPNIVYLSYMGNEGSEPTTLNNEYVYFTNTFRLKQNNNGVLEDSDLIYNTGYLFFYEGTLYTANSNQHLIPIGWGEIGA